MSSPHMILLGIGHSESEKYHNSNALVATSTGNLLLDCGHTIKHALRDQGMGLVDVDAVFISHVHGDHVFGLERLGFESRYKFNKRVTLYLEPDIYPILWHECLKGSMGYSSDGENRLEDFFDVHLIEEHRFSYGGCDFISVPTTHTEGKPSYGVAINDRLLFTSDTNILPWLKASDYELVIHDCTLQEGNPVHASLGELRESYSEELRRKILIIHCDDEVDAIRDELTGEFFGVAEQGQRIVL